MERTGSLQIASRLGRRFVGRASRPAPEPGAPRLGAAASRLRAPRHQPLASPEFAGPAAAKGAGKAAAYLVEAFQRARARAALRRRVYAQPIPGREPGQVLGRNVGARLGGADPQLARRVGHRLGPFRPSGRPRRRALPRRRRQRLGRGHDARGRPRLARGPEKPRRSLMFIGFDLEEVGLFGSRYFVEHPPVPLDRITLFVTADMIGRALGGVCDSHVFVMGTEHAPGPASLDRRGAARDSPLQVGLLGSDLLVLNRSDYGPFRARKVPYLFFSTGENPRLSLARGHAENARLSQARGDQPGHPRRRPPGRVGRCPAALDRSARQPARRGRRDPRRPPHLPRAPRRARHPPPAVTCS